MPNKTLLNENEGAKLINAKILEVVDEGVFQAGLGPVADELGFVTVNVEIPDGEFTSVLGATPLEEIPGEFDDFPIVNGDVGYTKGYKLKRFGGRLGMSKIISKWIQASSSSAKIDPTVKSALGQIAADTSNLVRAVQLTKNELVTRVLTDGFSVTQAYGPGSPYGDGQPLFSANHVIKQTGGTQSNLQTGALAEATLLQAIEKLRAMKDGNGRTMRPASEYTLVVGTALEATARKVLNDGSVYAAFDSTGTTVGNSITSNTFAWDGFRVKLLVLDTIGQPDGKGGTVGTDTQWFVIDCDRATEMRAFKYINLYSEEFDMWYDPRNKAVYADVDLSFNADFYNYECIVGSQGT